MTGVAGDGESIICEDNDGLRWEPGPTEACAPGAAHAAGWLSFARIHWYGSRSGSRLALRRS